MLKMSSAWIKTHYEHVWSRTVAPFQRSRGSSELFDRHKKWVGEVSIFNILGVLTVPTDKNIKKWGRANVGAVYRKLSVCRHILIWTFFLVLVWETHPLKFVKAFIYTLHRFTNAAAGRITQRGGWHAVRGLDPELNNQSPPRKSETSHPYVSHSMEGEDSNGKEMGGSINEDHGDRAPGRIGDHIACGRSP